MYTYENTDGRSIFFIKIIAAIMNATCAVATIFFFMLNINHVSYQAFPIRGIKKRAVDLS